MTRQARPGRLGGYGHWILMANLALVGCAIPPSESPPQVSQAPSAPTPIAAPIAERPRIAVPATTPVRAIAPVAQPQHPTDREVFRTIAAELLANLPAGKRIAIQPFRASDVPVPLPTAQGFNNALARAIETAPEGGGVIVAREELPRLFGEAEEFGEAASAQKLLESVRADVLVIGALSPATGGVQVTYKAFDAKDGHQIASAAPHVVAVDLGQPTGLGLDQALASAVDAMAEQASDMKSVETLGIYYQQSDVETPLGSYVARELTGRLVERIHGLSATPATLLRPEKSQQAAGAEEMMIRGRPGAYLLSGTLWDLGQDVEVRISLRGSGERIASYGARIRKDSIPASMLPLAPATIVARNDASMLSGLQLSSDRGRRPVYTIGDAARLSVQTARDGYLYCFHQSSPAAGGGVIKLFPNPYHPDPHIRAGASVQIPDDKMGFALKVFGPAGVEYVRCFVSDRDVTANLPPAILTRDMSPLGVHSLDDIGRMFRNVGAVTEATLVMTVESKAATAKP